MKKLGAFTVEPNGGSLQEIIVSSPDTAKVMCYGQQATDSLRLVCTVADYSVLMVSPTASTKDGSELL